MLTDAFNLRSSAFICGSFFHNTKAASFSYRARRTVKIFKEWTGFTGLTGNL